ncbi:MAG: nitroreductase family protein [Chloroflexota bacterium]
MNNPAAEFWAFLDQLAADHPLVIDRPRASLHPRFPSLVYPLDYGYLDGTTTVDGGGLDVFLGSLPDRRLEALALTVDLHKRDAEIKLLLGCTPAEQALVMEFLHGGGMRAVFFPRPAPASLALAAPTVPLAAPAPAALASAAPAAADLAAADLAAAILEAWPAALAWLAGRRSVRRFLPRPLAPGMLAQLLETAALAPSAHNRQPWRFAALESAAARRALADALAGPFRRDLLADGLPEPEAEARVQRSQQRISQAPAAVLLCLDQAGLDRYPGARRQAAEDLMGAQSLALAGGWLLLAAHALGLGAVWICAPLFAPDAARAALDLPAGWQPQALILLGYPARRPPARPRKPLHQVVKFL